MKTAILQCADTGPLESLVLMLRTAGYRCLIPDQGLLNALRDAGCDTVLDIADLVRYWGYDEPTVSDRASLKHMDRANLYVDVKAHRACPKIVQHWPNLRGKVLWYRINGGKPEHVVTSSGFDCGDEIDPPCPILTPNQWYKEPGARAGRVYTCWPPFVRFADHDFPRVHNKGWRTKYDPPICLIHNLQGWGYGRLIKPLAELGIRMHGVASPNGLIQHHEIPVRLSSALCMVHLKSSDAPGYALYEALASACPVVCTRRLIWRCRMGELLIPGKTCLVFDRETHEGLTDQDVIDCTSEVQSHLQTLSDPKENGRIGLAGRERLKELMWNEKRDGAGFRAFMERHFG